MDWNQLKQVVWSLALISGIGFLAIGASGALSAGMGAAFGHRFVAGDFEGEAYTKERCAYFLENYPKAATCEAAATEHHYDEVVMYRTSAGVLGLLILGATWVFRRRLKNAEPLRQVAFVPTVGAAVFGLAAVGFMFLSVVGMIVNQTNGAGQILSAGIVASIVAAVFSARFARDVLRSDA